MRIATFLAIVHGIIGYLSWEDSWHLQRMVRAFGVEIALLGPYPTGKKLFTL